MMPASNGHERQFAPIHGKARKDVETTIDNYYDELTGRYKSGWNDSKVADRHKIVPAQVEEIRVARYGEMTPDPDLDEWVLIHKEMMRDIELKKTEACDVFKQTEKVCDEQSTLFTEINKKLDEIKGYCKLVTEEQKRIIDCRKAMHRIRDELNERCNRTAADHILAMEQGPPKQERKGRDPKTGRIT